MSKKRYQKDPNQKLENTINDLRDQLKDLEKKNKFLMSELNRSSKTKNITNSTKTIKMDKQSENKFKIDFAARFKANLKGPKDA